MKIFTEKLQGLNVSERNARHYPWRETRDGLPVVCLSVMPPMREDGDPYEHMEHLGRAKTEVEADLIRQKLLYKPALAASVEMARMRIPGTSGVPSEYMDYDFWLIDATEHEERG